MRGWTLRYRLQQRLVPTPHQVYNWLKMIAIAMTKLHDHNIVHDNIRCAVLLGFKACAQAWLTQSSYSPT